MAPENGSQAKSGGLRQFLVIVAVLFGLIVAALLIASAFSDGGMMPFDYEGFD